MKKAKVIFIIFTILYVISPIDAIPGPLDDLVLILLNFALNYRRHVIEEAE